MILTSNQVQMDYVNTWVNVIKSYSENFESIKKPLIVILEDYAGVTEADLVYYLENPENMQKTYVLPYYPIWYSGIENEKLISNQLENIKIDALAGIDLSMVKSMDVIFCGDADGVDRGEAASVLDYAYAHELCELSQRPVVLFISEFNNRNHSLKNKKPADIFKYYVGKFRRNIRNGNFTYDDDDIELFKCWCETSEY